MPTNTKIHFSHNTKKTYKNTYSYYKKMFQSYTYKEYLGYKDGNHSFEYELVDSEFGTVSGVVVGDGPPIAYTNYNRVGVGVAVIQEYSKRKLNVGKNLMLAFIWYNKQHPYYSIQKMIDYNKKRNPLFSQYEEDLQKYLLLL